MNNDIKEGAELIAKGLKEDAKEVRDKLVDRYDTDGDGKVDLKELREGISKDAREGAEKIKSLASEGNLRDKAKADVAEKVAQAKPVIEAAKMEAEIEKEKIEAKILREKEIAEMKKEVLK